MTQKKVMASPPLSSSPSSSKSSPLLSHSLPTHFTPIQECEREGEEWLSEERNNPNNTKHHPTPLHVKKGNKRQGSNCSTSGVAEDDGSVSCNKCRPHSREKKISVVPLDNTTNNTGVKKNPSLSFAMSSPNGIFKSIFSSLTRKSPRSSSTSTRSGDQLGDEQWKVAIAELSEKLIQATRKRDEAVLEASRLKHSVSQLEKKLNKLELYCHNLKSGLEECTFISSSSPYNKTSVKNCVNNVDVSDKMIIERFLVSISEARTSVRMLARSLTILLRHLGGRALERISFLLQNYEIKISFSQNPKNVIFYLEALLNKALFEDFESIAFQKSSTNQILSPIDSCEANYAAFNALKQLTWDDVLSRGTRHFSEEFSKFCDRKMSDIVAMLGWNRAWPEPLLQAFFGASKSVWLVHLLANSVHPGLPIFRVDKGFGFDPVYMEEMCGDRARKLVPDMVRIMVAPGFYVYGNVVKCKVLCSYQNSNLSISNDYNKGLMTPSP